MEETEYLKKYQAYKYDLPSVTTDILIFSMTENFEYLQLLLIKRKGHPFMNQWAIPGGFVNKNENLEEAAKRELFEETHVKTAYLEQLYTFGDIERDPRTRVISIVYMALTKNDCQVDVQVGDDAKEASWFLIKKEKDQLVLSEEKGQASLTLNDLAFDHGEIVKMALERLKNKVEYTDVGFELLPKHFTLNQVQKVYEALLQRKVNKPNFRRDIIQKCEADGKMILLKMGRPAASYHYIKLKKKY